MDPFSTLGIPATFDVDLSVAERIHRDLSRALHPDRYVGASVSERRIALAKAVEVNEAWRTVRDPIRRAEALLALRGVSVGDGASQVSLSPAFLMQMIELREALAGARAPGDAGAVHTLASDVEARARRSEGELSCGFKDGKGSELLTPLAELRFYRRFLDEVGAIEDDFAI
jgi:molecular chaperone HscB